MKRLNEILGKYNVHFDSAGSVDFMEAIIRLNDGRMTDAKINTELIACTSHYDGLYQNPGVVKEVLQEIRDGPSGRSGEELLKDALRRRDEADAIESEIMEWLSAAADEKRAGRVEIDMGDDVYLISDPEAGRVDVVEPRVARRPERRIPVLDAAPIHIQRYMEVLDNEPPVYHVTFRTGYGRVIRLGPAEFQDIQGLLYSHGLVLNQKRYKDVFTFLISGYESQGLVDIVKRSITPGVYYDELDEEVYYSPFPGEDKTDGPGLTEAPGVDEIRACIRILDELAAHYENPEILGTVLKWALVAPYSYIRKKIGYPWQPWLYIYGAAGTGKTTLAKISLYLHGVADKDLVHGGSGFNTQAKIGRVLSKSTFPTIVNEPREVFTHTGTSELVKSAVESTVSRGVHRGSQWQFYKTIPSLSPIIFTANYFVPDDDAMQRRLVFINVTAAERRSPTERREFEDKFQVDTPHLSPLRGLSALGRFTYSEISADPELLRERWDVLAGILINRFYADAGEEPPEWLIRIVRDTNLDEYDETMREAIRAFIIDEVNRHLRSIRVYDEDSYIGRDAYTDMDIEEKLGAVLNNGLISYLLKDYQGRVLFTTQFKREISRREGIHASMEELAETMGEGFRYQRVQVSREGERIRCICVEEERLIQFLARK